MKRAVLLNHLCGYGCYLKRQGANHSLWCNPLTGQVETVLPYSEIPDKLARRITRKLSLPEV